MSKVDAAVFNGIIYLYETGNRSKDFTEVTMIALKKKPQATKRSDHRTISPIAHTANTVAKISKTVRLCL